MSDERTRALERRWQQTGRPEDGAGFLAQCVRTGALTPERLRLAAGLGDPAARIAAGEDVDAGQDPLGAAIWSAALDGMALQAFACDCAAAALARLPGAPLPGADELLARGRTVSGADGEALGEEAREWIFDRLFDGVDPDDTARQHTIGAVGSAAGGALESLQQAIELGHPVPADITSWDPRTRAWLAATLAASAFPAVEAELRGTLARLLLTPADPDGARPLARPIGGPRPCVRVRSGQGFEGRVTLSTAGGSAVVTSLAEVAHAAVAPRREVTSAWLVRRALEVLAAGRRQGVIAWFAADCAERSWYALPEGGVADGLLEGADGMRQAIREGRENRALLAAARTTRPRFGPAIERVAVSGLAHAARCVRSLFPERCPAGAELRVPVGHAVDALERHQEAVYLTFGPRSRSHHVAEALDCWALTRLLELAAGAGPPRAEDDVVAWGAVHPDGHPMHPLAAPSPEAARAQLERCLGPWSELAARGYGVERVELPAGYVLPFEEAPGSDTSSRT